MTSDNETLHSVDDTVRVAMGFVMGGFTAVYFNIGYIGIAGIAAGIVLAELLLGFISVMYTAHRSRNNESQ